MVDVVGGGCYCPCHCCGFAGAFAPVIVVCDVTGTVTASFVVLLLLLVLLWVSSLWLSLLLRIL